jgi:hypothetical protein
MGARNCPFLTFTAPARLGRCHKQIGLPAEKGRDLQNIHDLGHFCALIGQMYVCEDRNVEPGTQLTENLKCLVEPDPTRTLQTGAVGLVERGFVDKPQTQLAGHFLQRRGHIDGVIAALHGAGPGNQSQRRCVGKGHTTCRNCLRRAHLF